MVTLMPNGAISAASASCIASTAHFDMLWAPEIGWATRAGDAGDAEDVATALFAEIRQRGQRSASVACSRSDMQRERLIPPRGALGLRVDSVRERRRKPVLRCLSASFTRLTFTWTLRCGRSPCETRSSRR